MTDSERLDAVEKRADAHDQRVGLLATRMTDVEKGNDRADHLLVEHEQRLKAVEAAEQSEVVSVVKRVLPKLKPYLPLAAHAVGYLATALLCLTIGSGGCNAPVPDPPTPAPTPTPTPTPTPPAPVPGTQKFFFMILEDKTKPFAGRGDFFADAATWSAIKARHTWRDWDVNSLAPPAEYVPYLAYAKGQTLPYVVIVDQASGAMVTNGPMPTKAADLLKLLQSKGG